MSAAKRASLLGSVGLIDGAGADAQGEWYKGAGARFRGIAAQLGEVEARAVRCCAWDRAHGLERGLVADLERRLS